MAIAVSFIPTVLVKEADEGSSVLYLIDPPLIWLIAVDGAKIQTREQLGGLAQNSTQRATTRPIICTLIGT